jgi:hypothetical protein
VCRRFESVLRYQSHSNAMPSLLFLDRATIIVSAIASAATRRVKFFANRSVDRVGDDEVSATEDDGGARDP